ncbi:hypothetical protein K7X08_022109 [Anisodus acutangulus]|uniref:Uncharacterized protein n=1 Tax=Anisodus acutangulus TaxID=402998 RepID=A0A9Q1L3B4_9SOLA|nr:hypothetical protein K7X08_022109 [Anisodus acutangulus]
MRHRSNGKGRPRNDPPPVTHAKVGANGKKLGIGSIEVSLDIQKENWPPLVPNRGAGRSPTSVGVSTDTVRVQNKGNNVSMGRGLGEIGKAASTVPLKELTAELKQAGQSNPGTSPSGVTVINPVGLNEKEHRPSTTVVNGKDAFSKELPNQGNAGTK